MAKINYGIGLNIFWVAKMAKVLQVAKFIFIPRIKKKLANTKYLLFFA